MPVLSAPPATDAARRTCRRKGCAHEECRLAVNRMQKEIKARVEQGRTNKVPAEVARRAIEQRRKELGNAATDNVLARQLGLPFHAIRDVTTGRANYVIAKTFKRICEAPLGEPDKVFSRASTLRLRAVNAEGWDNTTLARHGFHRTLYTRWEYIDYGVALRVLDFVRTAGPGPSHRAMVTARNKGWKPRSAYDQDLFLDPLWDGIGGLLEEVPEMSKEEIRDEFWLMVNTGTHPYEAAARVGKDEQWARDMTRGTWAYEKVRRVY